MPQPKISKSITELLSYLIILYSTSNKNADLIEKGNYSNAEDQIVDIIKCLHCHQRRFVSIKKDFLTVRSVF